MFEITPAERLFVEAQTPGSTWLDRPVEESTITRLYDLVRLPPTAFNASPARFVFVRSPEARQQLLEVVSCGNRAKVQNAPLTVILGYDLLFFEELPRLFPKYDASRMFRDDPALAERTAFHSSTLQAAYLFIAARALGLDVAPLSGFDPECVEAAFFPSGTIRANVLCCLGYAQRDPAQTRHPRLDFHEVCRIV
jgi:3-hydroxypropanoate dehydrogenase